MTEKQRAKELEELKRDLASLREEISLLIAQVKTGSDKGTGAAPADEEGTDREQWHERWADFQVRLEEARSRGEKALKDLGAEVERHPFRSIAAAIGFGFIIARLFGRGRSH